GCESGDGEKRGRDGDGAAAVTADSAERKAGRDACGFAAAAAPARVGEIPWIAGGAGEAIVGFVSHQEFRSVGGAEEDGTGGAEAFDDGREVGSSFLGAGADADGDG